MPHRLPYFPLASFSSVFAILKFSCFFPSVLPQPSWPLHTPSVLSNLLSFSSLPSFSASPFCFTKSPSSCDLSTILIIFPSCLIDPVRASSRPLLTSWLSLFLKEQRCFLYLLVWACSVDPWSLICYFSVILDWIWPWVCLPHWASNSRWTQT